MAKSRWVPGQPATSSSGKTSSTSRTGSTFEEVESLDLAGTRAISRDFSSFDDQYSMDMSRSLDLTGNPNFGKINFVHLVDNLRQSYSPSSGSHNTTSQHSMTSLEASSETPSEPKKSRRRTRQLIVPDADEDEQFPFAKHVFNKKDKKEKSDKKKNNSGAGYHRMRSSLFDQLMQYKLQHQMSDSSQSTPSSLHSVPVTPDATRLPFESDYDYYVRVRRNSTTSSGPQSSVGGRLSRTMSLESSSSSNLSSSSPYPAAIPAPSFSTASAEEVLMNLGFCGQGSFLPERFARDWYAKIVTAKNHREQTINTKERENPEKHEPSHHRVRRGAADFLHKLDLNSRTSASSRRAKLRRSATMLTQSTGKQQSSEVEKQDSIDQLKSVLSKQANILQSAVFNDVGKEKKRKAFATSRQKSLPLFLETLTEEDEHRVSRGPSLESPQRGKGKLHEFMEEEENMHQSQHSSRQTSRSSSKDSDSSREVHNILSSNIHSTCSTMPNSLTGSFDSESTDRSTRSSTNMKISSNKPHNPAEMSSSGSSVALPTIVIPAVTDSNLNSHNATTLTPPVKLLPEQPKHKETSKTRSVEPAMVSIVLSDTEEEKHGKKGMHLCLSGIGDDNLLSPASVSPCPLSPITVIELDQLDNQNLDTDSGDNTNDSPETHQSVDTKAMAGPLFPKMPKVVIENLEEGNKEHSTSKHNMEDCSVETDNRALSPLSLFPKEGSPQGSESAYSSCEDDRTDHCVQADDGTLSPIMFHHHDPVLKSPVEYYIVNDAQTQSVDIQMTDAEAQTSETINTESSLRQTSDSGSSWTFGRSFSDFEPQYFMSEGCQTDPLIFSMESEGSTENMGVVFATMEGYRGQLCEACQDVVQRLRHTPMQGSSTDLTTESMDLESDTSHISIDITEPDCNHNDTNDQESPTQTDGKAKSRSKKGRRLSYLDIMEMLERSESVPDYLERNLDLPSEHKMMDSLAIASDALQRSESMPEDPHHSFDLCGKTPDIIVEDVQLLPTSNAHIEKTSNEQTESDKNAETPSIIVNEKVEDDSVQEPMETEQEITKHEQMDTSVVQDNQAPDSDHNKENNNKEVQTQAKPKRPKRSRDVNLDQRLQRFDLEGLLSRIERIENMISAVTSVYAINGVHGDLGGRNGQNVPHQMSSSLPYPATSQRTLLNSTPSDNYTDSVTHTEDITNDISDMVTALNSSNSVPATLTETSRAVTPNSAVQELNRQSHTPNIQSPLVQQFERQPRRRLTKTTSMDVANKRPMLSKMLSKKRSSLQRQSNIDMMSPAVAPEKQTGQNSIEDIDIQYNLWQRRNTDGLLHGLHSPLTFESVPEVDEDKLSVVSDILGDEDKDDIAEDEVEEDEEDIPMLRPRKISNRDIDTEIAKMRYQLQVMSSESSDRMSGGSYISLFEKFNVNVAELPLVSQFPSSITKGVLKSLSGGSQDHFGSRSRVSDLDEDGEYMSTTELKDSIVHYSKKIESAFLIANRRRMLKHHSSKSSSIHSSKSQPLRQLTKRPKLIAFASDGNDVLDGREMSASSFENPSGEIVSKRKKVKPKDINQFQRMWMHFSQSSEKGEGNDSMDSRRKDKPKDINEFQRMMGFSKNTAKEDVATDESVQEFPEKCSQSEEESLSNISDVEEDAPIKAVDDKQRSAKVLHNQEQLEPETKSTYPYQGTSTTSATDKHVAQWIHRQFSKTSSQEELSPLADRSPEQGPNWYNVEFPGVKQSVEEPNISSVSTSMEYSNPSIITTAHFSPLRSVELPDFSNTLNVCDSLAVGGPELAVSISSMEATCPSTASTCRLDSEEDNPSSSAVEETDDLSSPHEPLVEMPRTFSRSLSRSPGAQEEIIDTLPSVHDPIEDKRSRLPSRTFTRSLSRSQSVQEEINNIPSSLCESTSAKKLKLLSKSFTRSLSSSPSRQEENNDLTQSSHDSIADKRSRLFSRSFTRSLSRSPSAQEEAVELTKLLSEPTSATKSRLFSKSLSRSPSIQEENPDLTPSVHESVVDKKSKLSHRSFTRSLSRSQSAQEEFDLPSYMSKPSLEKSRSFSMSLSRIASEDANALESDREKSKSLSRSASLSKDLEDIDLDDDKSLESERERLAADIAENIYDNIHKQIMDRTEHMSDMELDYTILRAVNSTMDKLLEEQAENDDMPLGWPDVQAAL